MYMACMRVPCPAFLLSRSAVQSGNTNVLTETHYGAFNSTICVLLFFCSQEKKRHCGASAQIHSGSGGPAAWSPVAGATDAPELEEPPTVASATGVLSAPVVTASAGAVAGPAAAYAHLK